MAIAVEGVVKSFAGVRVLDNVAVSVADGEIHALRRKRQQRMSATPRSGGVSTFRPRSISIKDRTIPRSLRAT